MSTAFFILAPLALVATLAVMRRPEPDHREGFDWAWRNFLEIMPRVAVAVVAAGFIAELLPRDQLASVVGTESGLTGILLAALVGGFIPGGPMVVYPLALALMKAGAGPAQAIAFVTAWSTFSVQRLLTYELPLLGSEFARRRYGVSLWIPVGAGLLALALLAAAPFAVAF